MQTRDFCFWLQGYFELTASTDTSPLTPLQVNVIKEHLDLVFRHEIAPKPVQHVVPAQESQSLDSLAKQYNPMGIGGIAIC